jgi:hypothetical protein
VDCTSDVTHKEQLTIVLRTVTIVPGKATQVGENFFDTAGKDLLEAVLNGAKDIKIITVVSNNHAKIHQ